MLNISRCFTCFCLTLFTLRCLVLASHFLNCVTHVVISILRRQCAIGFVSNLIMTAPGYQLFCFSRTNIPHFELPDRMPTAWVLRWSKTWFPCPKDPWTWVDRGSLHCRSRPRLYSSIEQRNGRISKDTSEGAHSLSAPVQPSWLECWYAGTLCGTLPSCDRYRRGRRNWEFQGMRQPLVNICSPAAASVILTLALHRMDQGRLC